MKGFHSKFLLILCWALSACDGSPTEDKGVVAPAVEAAETQSKNGANKPNILLIVADDLGFTDLGSFGGEIATPNLDALARQGMILSNFYTAPTCSPTRAMLMTGVDNHLAGVGAMSEFVSISTNLKGRVNYEGYLTDRAASLPEIMKSAGYNTYMSGKWHLGFDKEQSPTARGFDRTFAMLDGGAGYFDDSGLFSPKAQFREDGKITTELPEGFYATEFYTRKMQEYLTENQALGKPFFAYLAYTAPHWPLQALPETIELYRGKYDDGYEALHRTRIQGAMEAGVASPISPNAVKPSRWMTPWNDLSDGERAIQARAMEIYAAMIHDMDVYIGQLINMLDRQGVLENTIIFFMSDNGAEGLDVKQLAVMAPPIADYIANSFNNEFDNLGKPGSYLFAGPGWARASVGPNSLYKGSTADGGIKSPAFLRYPDMPDASTISTRFMTVKDVMPTLLELAGVEPPQGSFQRREILPVEGTSMLQAQDPEQVSMAWELHGHKAVRHGDWKLVSLSGPFGDKSWKLYDLKNDPAEQNDLASGEPEKLAEMIRRWDKYAQSSGVIEPQLRFQATEDVKDPE